MRKRIFSAQTRQAPATFRYKDFDIPIELAMKTGGGPDTWAAIAEFHMGEYRRYCPIANDHAVLEVGCGVGRDAMLLADVIGPEGSYLGIDIIRPSIEWCQQNISPRYPQFRFEWIDIKSQLHNPRGVVAVTDIHLPAPNNWADRIILQSVFTHMFEPDIAHYLRDFRRILKADGIVFASFFIIDDDSLELARATAQPLTFPFPWGDGCFVNDGEYPEGAVGYTPNAFSRIIRQSGFCLDQELHPGSWCGRQDVFDGQDIAILRPCT